MPTGDYSWSVCCLRGGGARVAIRWLLVVVEQAPCGGDLLHEALEGPSIATCLDNQYHLP